MSDSETAGPTFVFKDRVTPIAKLSPTYRSDLKEAGYYRRAAVVAQFLRDLLEQPDIADEPEKLLDQLKENNGALLCDLGSKLTGKKVNNIHFWHSLMGFKDICLELGIAEDKCFGPTEFQRRQIGPILECLTEVHAAWTKKSGGEQSFISKLFSWPTSGQKEKTTQSTITATGTPITIAAAQPEWAKSSTKMAGSRSFTNAAESDDEASDDDDVDDEANTNDEPEKSRERRFTEQIVDIEVISAVADDEDSSNNILNNDQLSLYSALTESHAQEKKELEEKHQISLETAQKFGAQVADLNAELERAQANFAAEKKKLEEEHAEALKAEAEKAAAQKSVLSTQAEEMQQQLEQAIQRSDKSEKHRDLMAAALKSHQAVVQHLRQELLQLKETMTSCTQFAESEVCLQMHCAY